MRIAIGPEEPTARWAWLGCCLYRELSRYFQVEVFKAGQNISAADAALVVGASLGPEIECGPPLIFMPPDSFFDDEGAARARIGCRVIVCQSDAMAEAFGKIHPRVRMAPCYTPFALPEPNAFKSAGPLIWIGAFRHVPALAAWLAVNPVDFPIIAMTERPGKHRLPRNVELRPWSPRSQYDLLKDARAALDIAGLDFRGRCRPPETALSYLISGIPCASIPGSGQSLQLRKMGIELAGPTDLERLFSPDYHAACLRWGREAVHGCSPRALGERLKEIIEESL